MGTAALWCASRLWYLIAGVRNLRKIHRIRGGRFAVAIIFGFLPAYTVLSVITAGYAWLLITVAVLGWD
jgi:hypothetical protein